MVSSYPNHRRGPLSEHVESGISMESIQMESISFRFQRYCVQRRVQLLRPIAWHPSPDWSVQSRRGLTSRAGRTASQFRGQFVPRSSDTKLSAITLALLNWAGLFSGTMGPVVSYLKRTATLLNRYPVSSIYITSFKRLRPQSLKLVFLNWHTFRILYA